MKTRPLVAPTLNWAEKIIDRNKFWHSTEDDPVFRDCYWHEHPLVPSVYINEDKDCPYSIEIVPKELYYYYFKLEYAMAVAIGIGRDKQNRILQTEEAAAKHTVSIVRFERH